MISDASRPRSRERKHGDRTEVVEANDALVFEAVLDLRDLHQRNLGRGLRGIHVKVLDVRQLRPLVASQARHHRYVLVAFLQCCHRNAAQRSCRRICDVVVCDPRKVRTLRIDLQRHLRTFILPLIAHPTGGISGVQNVLDLARDGTKVANVFRARSRTDVSLAGDPHFHWIVHRVGLQLPEVGAHTRQGSGKNRLHLVDEAGCNLFVVQLNQHLRVIQLSGLRR